MTIKFQTLDFGILKSVEAKKGGAQRMKHATNGVVEGW